MKKLKMCFNSYKSFEVIALAVTFLCLSAVSVPAQDESVHELWDRIGKWHLSEKNRELCKKEKKILISPADLIEGIKNHQQWEKSKGMTGKKLVLENHCLIGVPLHGVNLSKVNLRGSWLNNANLSNSKLNDADLNHCHFTHANLLKTDFSYSRLSHSQYLGVSGEGALFIYAKMNDAKLMTAYLNLAMFDDADLSDSDARHAYFRGAHFSNTNLIRTNLIGTDLREAEFKKTDMSGADVRSAKLNGAIFEVKRPPYLISLSLTSGLSELTYSADPSALFKLRRAFRENGFRTQERIITYDIERAKTKIDPSSPTELMSSTFETLVKKFLFEWPCAWGMAPLRPLLFMAGGIFLFIIPYYFSLRITSNDGIWRYWAPDRCRKDLGDNTPELLKRKGAIWKCVGYAFYFSLLSAFHIGWRDLNVGAWISRISLKEYTLRATGWVRVVSGVQSLISVYLVALAILSYFGRPFG